MRAPPQPTAKMSSGPLPHTARKFSEVAERQAREEGQLLLVIGKLRALVQQARLMDALELAQTAEEELTTRSVKRRAPRVVIADAAA